MGQLRRERPRATFKEHREPRHEEGLQPVAEEEVEGGMRSRVALPTKMRSRRTRFPPVDTSPRYTLPSDPMDDDDLKSIGGGSRVHCYRDNTSIFSDSLYGHPGIIFPQTKRMLPWEEILEKGGSGGVGR